MISKKVTCHNAAVATAVGELMNLESISLVALQISGTFVAMVTFQGTVDESNWIAIQGTNVNDGSVATSATAAGIWLIPVSGLKKFRANLTWTSGTSVTVVARGVEYGVGLTLADIDVAGVETVSINQGTPGTTDSVTVATGQGAGKVIGAATSDAAVITDATGTVHQYLRGLVKLIVAKINIATVDTVTTITNAVAVTNAVLGGATSDAAVITDATGSVHQYLRGIVKLLAAIITVKIDQTTPGTTNKVVTGDNKITIVQTPAISAAGIYADGDAVGGLLTFANASLGAGKTGTVLSVIVLDLDKELAPMDLVLWNVTFTATADNAAFDPSDADLANCIGHILIASGDYASFNDNSIATVRNVNLDYTLTGTSLFGQLVARGTPTYTAVGDLTVKLVCQRD